jgi:hypothetical protein
MESHWSPHGRSLHTHIAGGTLDIIVRLLAAPRGAITSPVGSRERGFSRHSHVTKTLLRALPLGLGRHSGCLSNSSPVRARQPR